jgi:hypothetical protein
LSSRISSAIEEANIADTVASIYRATDDDMEENLSDTVASIDRAYEEGLLSIEEGKAILDEILVEVVMDDATAQRKHNAQRDLKEDGGTKRRN